MGAVTHIIYGSPQNIGAINLDTLKDLSVKHVPNSTAVPQPHSPTAELTYGGARWVEMRDNGEHQNLVNHQPKVAKVYEAPLTGGPEMLDQNGRKEDTLALLENGVSLIPIGGAWFAGVTRLKYLEAWGTKVFGETVLPILNNGAHKLVAYLDNKVARGVPGATALRSGVGWAATSLERQAKNLAKVAQEKTERTQASTAAQHAVRDRAEEGRDILEYSTKATPENIDDTLNALRKLQKEGIPEEIKKAQSDHARGERAYTAIFDEGATRKEYDGLIAYNNRLLAEDLEKIGTRETLITRVINRLEKKFNIHVN